MNKKCSNCGDMLSSSLFYKQALSKDGMQTQCKACLSAKDKIRYKANHKKEKKENANRYRKMTQEPDPRIVRAEKKCSGCKTIKSIKCFGNYSGSPDKHYYYCKECRSNHTKTNKYKSKEYECRNRHKRNERNKRRIEARPDLRLNRVIKAHLNRMLKRLGLRKTQTSFAYFPYSAIELRTHLESQFEPWMNWDNYGRYNVTLWDDEDPLSWTWQIDHIIPQHELLYRDITDENFKKCWALSNLRPFPAKQNVIDGARKLTAIQRHK